MNPWLTVPASEYEGHMITAGQLPALSAIFRDVYLQWKPRRLAVLGCATGNGFEHVVSSVTEHVIGVDINAAYLGVARMRFAASGFKLTPIHGDILQTELEPESLDLVHAALVLEYADPELVVPKIAKWLSPHGVCCVVLQREGPQPKVTPTGFQSVRALAGIMRLHQPETIRALASSAGLISLRSWEVPLPNEKSFSVNVYGRK